MSLDEITFDTTFVDKHGAYTILSHVCTQTGLQGSNFHVNVCILQRNERLAKFVNWELLVPRLKTYHVIIQSLNINSLHQHYLQHDHNLQKCHILCRQETIVKETSHFDMTKYNNICIFDKHDNILMYNNNVTLQSYRAVMHIKS